MSQILLARVRVLGRAVLPVAQSGIATLLLSGGTTAHSRFKIPISINMESTCFVPKQSNIAELIRSADLILWYECSITYRHAVEAVYGTLCDIMDTPNKLFGGKVVVFSGDFKQILLVVPRGTSSDVVNACLNQSTL